MAVQVVKSFMDRGTYGTMAGAQVSYSSKVDGRRANFIVQVQCSLNI
jgi:hypothetical protein